MSLFYCVCVLLRLVYHIRVLRTLLGCVLKSLCSSMSVFLCRDVLYRLYSSRYIMLNIICVPPCMRYAMSVLHNGCVLLFPCLTTSMFHSDDVLQCLWYTMPMFHCAHITQRICSNVTMSHNKYLLYTACATPCLFSSVSLFHNGQVEQAVFMSYSIKVPPSQCFAAFISEHVFVPPSLAMVFAHYVIKEPFCF